MKTGQLRKLWSDERRRDMPTRFIKVEMSQRILQQDLVGLREGVNDDRNMTFWEEAIRTHWQQMKTRVYDAAKARKPEEVERARKVYRERANRTL